jgi:hypothetical protein
MVGWRCWYGSAARQCSVHCPWRSAMIDWQDACRAARNVVAAFPAQDAPMCGHVSQDAFRSA